MKLQFEANLQYQEQAVSAVVDLFRGQTPKRSVFTVTMEDDAGQMTTDNGIANKLELIEDEILENLQAVQLRNGLPQAKMLKKGAYDFDIEMETGTGKTYVYLRTIFELNKAYGFKKFIIVVPSIAIKEGVAKSLEITKEHFQTIYNNVVYDTYIYDGSKPEEVRSFAVNDKLKELILQMKAEISALRSGASTEYPDGVSPKKKAIAAYLRENPGVTNKSKIARDLNVNRTTVQKYYDEVQAEF